MSTPTVLKPVPSAPGFFAGDDGSIWTSAPRGGGGIRRLKLSRRKDGYLMVSVAGRSRYAHRLVLEAFAGPCPKGYVSYHLDGVRSNNAPSNLAWATPAGTSIRRAEFDPADAPLVFALYHQGWKQTALAARFGLDQREVSRLVRLKGRWANLTAPDTAPSGRCEPPPPSQETSA